MKHIHIIGICGTFMGGIAALAKEAGFKVTGCDANVYPPMSTQLEAMGIELIQGFDADQVQLNPDIFVIGNVAKRGNSLIEEVLNKNLPYISGPQWLYENILRHSWTLAVAGTHGKTTTSSMLAWILEYAGLKPGFLIGGVPENFSVSARMPQDSASKSFFVIEADEYDTAFFDKRSKFVHYHPRTAILNNLEYDHADIFPDLAAIQTQFHHLIRMIPSEGRIISNGQENNLQVVLDKGCWTPVETFGVPSGWHSRLIEGEAFEVYLGEQLQGRVDWTILGEHNRHNALASIAAAHHAGVPVAVACEALGQFKNVKRRMEVKGQYHGATVYDDFAHHPTAIETTIAGLRAKVGNERIIAVLEPRSNTMKQGVMKDSLPHALAGADLVYCYSGGLDWNVAEAMAPLQEKVQVFEDFDALLHTLRSIMTEKDHVLVMSNGGFQGIHDKLLQP